MVYNYIPSLWKINLDGERDNLLSCFVRVLGCGSTPQSSAYHPVLYNLCDSNRYTPIPLLQYEKKMKPSFNRIITELKTTSRAILRRCYALASNIIIMQ